MAIASLKYGHRERRRVSFASREHCAQTPYSLPPSTLLPSCMQFCPGCFTHSIGPLFIVLLPFVSCSQYQFYGGLLYDGANTGLLQQIHAHTPGPSEMNYDIKKLASHRVSLSLILKFD